MLHRSATYSFAARFRVYFQPVPPSSSGLSGLPGTLSGGGIDSPALSPGDCALRLPADPAIVRPPRRMICFGHLARRR